MYFDQDDNARSAVQTSALSPPPQRMVATDVDRSGELPTVSQLVAALSGHEALVDFVRSGDSYHAFVFSKAGTHGPVAIATEDEIDRAVQNRALSGRATRGVAPIDFTLSEDWGREAIYQLVWAKLEPLIPAVTTTIYIVAEGVTASIPFEALRGPDKKWLIERFMFGYLVSPGQLLRRAHAPRTSAINPRFLLVGNPAYGSFGMLSHLSSLPGAEAEVAAIADLLKRRYPAGAIELLIGKAATEQAVRARMGSMSIVHIASHGWTNYGLGNPRPTESTARVPEPRLDLIRGWPGLRAGLALSGPASADHIEPTNDGILTAAEIADMTLQVDLAVLSSCSTRGNVEAALGLTGLAGAFLSAGARELVVSLYQVDDRVTDDFMRVFYAELARSNLSGVAAALRRAKLKFIADRDHSMPRDWESFIIYTNGRLES